MIQQYSTLEVPNIPGQSENHYEEDHVKGNTVYLREYPSKQEDMLHCKLQQRYCRFNDFNHLERLMALLPHLPLVKCADMWYHTYSGQNLPNHSRCCKYK